MVAESSAILVTGAAGFVGFHLARSLIAQGHAVVGIDNFNSYYDPQLKEARVAELERHRLFTLIRCDLIDHDLIGALMKEIRPRFVVHLAAQAGVRYSIENPRAYIAANVDGFLSILEACRHVEVEHLIYASSSSVYGANNSLPFSEADRADHPVSLYAATKRANELMAHTYAHLFNVRSTGLRFFTVYGPWGRPDMAYYTFTKAIFEGREIEVYNDGNMSRDFTYIDDVVESIVRLLDLPPGRQAGGAAPHVVYNIGNHTPVSLERFIEIIGEKAQRPVRKLYRPMQPGDVRATYADVTALSAAVGFSPATSLEDGIEEFVAWYRDFHGPPEGSTH